METDTRLSLVIQKMQSVLEEELMFCHLFNNVTLVNLGEILTDVKPEKPEAADYFLVKRACLFLCYVLLSILNSFVS